jgi:hypothetical protein
VRMFLKKLFNGSQLEDAGFSIMVNQTMASS